MRSIRSDSDTSIWIILLEVVLIVAGVLLGLAANAWREGQQEAAQRTGAVNHLDFELVATLARLYDVQAFLQDKLDHVGTNFYVAGNVTLDDFGATATAFKLLVNDIVIQEERLRTRHYPETLTRIDDHLDRPAPALDAIGDAIGEGG
jgi:hypothetical protein